MSNEDGTQFVKYECDMVCTGDDCEYTTEMTFYVRKDEEPGGDLVICPDCTSLLEIDEATVVTT